MLNNREGQRVPQVTLPMRRENSWIEVNSEELFRGKRVVLFALPGAYTPTCSSNHLPRYNQLAPALRAQGIDEIMCVSVNDPCVMEQWAKDQNASDITFVPDGNGDFSRDMGMLVDKHDLGFGQRSWRYSMLVDDGVIKKMFIEPDKPGDPFEVSDADTMFAYIAPQASVPPDVTVFARQGCPYCADAKRRLSDAGIRFEELVLNRDYTEATLRAVTGQSEFPQVFVNGDRIGGAEDLKRYLQERSAA